MPWKLPPQGLTMPRRIRSATLKPLTLPHLAHYLPRQIRQPCQTIPVTVPDAVHVASANVAAIVPEIVSDPDAVDVAAERVLLAVPVLPTLPDAVPVAAPSVTALEPDAPTVPEAALVAAASVAAPVPLAPTLPVAVPVAAPSVTALEPVTLLERFDRLKPYQDNLSWLVKTLACRFTDWLSANAVWLLPAIYPQATLRLPTTVTAAVPVA